MLLKKLLSSNNSNSKRKRRVSRKSSKSWRKLSLLNSKIMEDFQSLSLLSCRILWVKSWCLMLGRTFLKCLILRKVWMITPSTIAWIFNSYQTLECKLSLNLKLFTNSAILTVISSSKIFATTKKQECILSLILLSSLKSSIKMGSIKFKRKSNRFMETASSHLIQWSNYYQPAEKTISKVSYTYCAICIKVYFQLLNL